jgi:hypothetical protein
MHLDALLTPLSWVEITPGARFDFWSSGGITAFSVDARLSARLGVTDRIRILHALGLAHQPPSFVIPGPGFQIGNLEGGLQQSAQMSAGVEIDMPAEITGSATFFYNGFFNMNDILGAGGLGSDETTLNDRSLGSGIGLEIYMKRRLTKQIGGYLSYTLSRSTRSIGRVRLPSRFDRTHVASAAVSWDLGRGWRGGTRLAFYTGTPNLDPPRILLDPSLLPERLPPFFRLDVRVEKRWRIGQRGFISLVLEALNATLAEETVAYACEPTSCQPQRIGPITIPSIGVEGGF